MREVLEQEAEMFKIGDYVAHYKEGVCEVVNIGKIDMGSSEKNGATRLIHHTPLCHFLLFHFYFQSVV